VLRRPAGRCLLVVFGRDDEPRFRARTVATGVRALLDKDQPAATVVAAPDTRTTRAAGGFS